MTEPADDILTRPLGTGDVAPPAPPPSGAAAAIARVGGPKGLAAIAAVGLVAAAGLLVAFGDPDAGEPTARAAIVLRDPPPKVAPAVMASAPPGRGSGLRT